MTPEGAFSEYTIEWAPGADLELDRMRAFDSRRILDAIQRLATQAEVETRNRKPLKTPLDELPDATWEVRSGEWRIFYEVRSGRIARILRVILKGRQTTMDALRERR